MPTFNASFNPFRGDVIYGTTEARADYLQSFLQSSQCQQLTTPPYQQPFSHHTRGIYINDYNEPVASANFTRPRDIQYPEATWMRQEDYLYALQNSRYAPSRVTSSTWQDYAKGDTAVGPNTMKTVEEWAELAKNLAVRRACKFGIEYVTTELQDARVHYILDRINLQEVVNKTPRVLTTTTYSAGVPITTSELRFLFRVWHRFRGRERVIFYLHGQSTQAPWESSPGAWVPYAVQRVNKYRTRVWSQGQLRNFDKAVNEGRHQSALNWFHDMRLNDN